MATATFYTCTLYSCCIEVIIGLISSCGHHLLCLLRTLQRTTRCLGPINTETVSFVHCSPVPMSLLTCSETSACEVVRNCFLYKLSPSACKFPTISLHNLKIMDISNGSLGYDMIRDVTDPAKIRICRFICKIHQMWMRICHQMKIR